MFSGILQKGNHLFDVPNPYGWRRQWNPTLVLLPGKSHGWRSLVSCSPWGRWVGHNWATSLWLFTFMHWRRKLQATPVFLPGESQGRGAWWAAVYGVTQSRTRLKWLSSSSSIQRKHFWLLIFSIACLFSISLISALYSSLLFVRGGS